EHGQRPLPADLRESGAHSATSLPGLNPPIPRSDRVLELAEALRDLARSFAAQLMTGRAAVGIDDLANPLALAFDGLRNAVAFGAGAGEVTLGRQLEQGEPV